MRLSIGNEHEEDRIFGSGSFSVSTNLWRPQLGIRLWILLRDQIDLKSCRRGRMGQKSDDPRAGMPEQCSDRATQWATRLPELLGSSNKSSWSTVTGEISGGQHRVDEVTRAERVGCNRKDKSTIAGESSARAKGVTAQMGMGVRTKKNRIKTPLTRPTSKKA